MPNWTGLILTQKGRALQAKVEAGATLNFTKMKTGSGVIPAGQQLESLNDLVAPEQNLGIASTTTTEDGYCQISSVISNAGLETGYYAKELGIFATDPNLGEILYAITTDSAADYFPAEGGATVVSQEFSVFVAISNASTVTVQIDSTALATVGYVQTAISTALKNYVKVVDQLGDIDNGIKIELIE